jgi:hypothetical protein
MSELIQRDSATDKLSRLIGSFQPITAQGPITDKHILINTDSDNEMHIYFKLMMTLVDKKSYVYVSAASVHHHMS